MKEFNMLNVGKTLIRLRRRDLFSDLESNIHDKLNTRNFKQNIENEITELEQRESLEPKLKELVHRLKAINIFGSTTSENHENLYENIYAIVNDPDIKEREDDLYETINNIYNLYKNYIFEVMDDSGKLLYAQNEVAMARQDKNANTILQTLKKFPPVPYSSTNNIVDQFKDYMFVVFLVDTDLEMEEDFLDSLADSIDHEVDEYNVDLELYKNDRLYHLEIDFSAIGEYLTKEMLDEVVAYVGKYLKDEGVAVFGVYTH